VLVPLVLYLDLIWRLLPLRLKILSTNLIILLATLFYPPSCDECVSLKVKLFHATKEKIELQQEVAYLTAYLEKTILSEKMIEEDLSRVKESATKSTYKLGISFERCEKKDEKSDAKFVPSSSYHKEEEALKPIKTHYASNPKPSFNPKRGVKRESPNLREEAFVCMFYGHVGHMDDFASGVRELRGGVLSMLETHIVMSSLISRLASLLLSCFTSHFFKCFSSVLLST
jgi:hypothetical protein